MGSSLGVGASVSWELEVDSAAGWIVSASVFGVA